MPADLYDWARSAALRKSSAAGNQVVQQHNHCTHEQQVDEASAHVQAEAQQPQDHKNRENRPKHFDPPP
jgi:hypothetical protein